MPWFVYMLQSERTGHLYTGVATDVQRRLEEHNTKKKGAKRTKAGRPWRVVYTERKSSRSAAASREHAIKSMKRSQKLALIADDD